MPGLIPVTTFSVLCRKTWMARTSPAMTIGNYRVPSTQLKCDGRAETANAATRS